MTTSPYLHQPVMVKEVLAGLAIQSTGIYIDATYGRGGHSGAILASLEVNGRLLAIDKDPQAFEAGLKKYGHDPRFTMERGSFAMLKNIAQQHDLLGKVNGILLDLGVSSPQLDDPQRGFSFMHDGPLDMRMDPTTGVSAATFLNTAKESDIAEILKTYGEERYARRIARAIVHERTNQALTTTGQLAAIIAKANPAWERFKHPATRSFQAIRIYINSEFNELKAVLEQCLEVLAISGRLVVISFHSLEDRIVKRFIKQHSQDQMLPAYLPIQKKDMQQKLRAIGRAIKPNDFEIKNNPRARSAVLRITEKLL